MKYLSIILALCLLGCSAEKQHQKKIAKTQEIVYQFPNEFAGVCSNLFPVKPTYIQGKDSIIERTITIKGDSIPCPKVAGQTKTVYVKCPDAKVIYRDVVRIDTVTIESSSIKTELANKTQELKLSKESDDRHKKTSDARLFWLIGLGILLLGSWYLLFTKW